MIRVLLVDDEVDLTSLLAAQLTRAGFEVRCADSLASARERAEQEPPFDVLVTDLSLPDGDGIDVARALGIARRLAITGSASPSDIQRLLAEGFYEVLIKPVTSARLGAAIHEAASRVV